MAFRYQLRDARNSLQIKSVAGLCTDGDEFVALLNEVLERLMDRGGFWETEFLIRICAYNGCLTWPRIVGTVLGIRNPCVGEFDIRNNWYGIIGPHHCGCDNFICDYTMRDNGTSPLRNAITGTSGKQIRYYATKNEDLNKSITLYGIDSNGQPLQEKVNGFWQRGLTIKALNPFGSTGAVLVREISSVTRDASQANMLLFEYDSVSQTQRELAVYEPSETNPRYRRSVIHNFQCVPGCSESDGVSIRKFDALVKLENVPVVHDLDFLPLDSFPAIKFGFEAIRLEEANQDGAAEVKWAKAIQALNFQDRNKQPENQFTVRVNPTGNRIYSPI